MAYNFCICGNYKSKQAKMCAECWDRYQQIMTTSIHKDYDHDECPECGGLKDRRAKTCRACYDKRVRGTRNICPECGGHKSKSARRVCRKCHNEKTRRKE